MFKKILGYISGERRENVDAVSLFDASTSSQYVRNVVAVLPCESIESIELHASPERIVRNLPARLGFWLQNVWVWPETGIVRTLDGKLIAETLPSKYRVLKMLRAGAYKHVPKPEKCIQVDLPIASLGGGRWYGHYYHWLVDEIPRLVGLDHAPEVEQLYVPCSYPDPIFDLVGQLAPAHVNVLRAPDRQQWIFARRYFYAPMLTEDYCGFLPKIFVRRLREVLQEYIADCSNERKIYISRSGASKRRVLNEDKVIDVLADYGFEAIQAEKLTFLDQIRLFAGTAHMVGPHGAGLTNMMFSRHCTVLELFPGAPFTHYRWLSASLGHSYGCLSGRKELGKHDDFEVDVDKLRRTVETCIQ